MTNGPSKKQTIWMLWLQGWDNAPSIAKSSFLSWENCNPSWTVQPLDAESALSVFGAHPPKILLRKDLPREAYSDILRIELLARFGGVWADATTICGKPLNEWLPPHSSERDFFAFSQPTSDRIIASWFLYATAEGYIISKLCDAVREYWHNRAERDDYFWLHKIFENLTLTDPNFRTLWEAPPHIPAQQPFHFGPRSARLALPPSPADQTSLELGKWPVFKLTHKFPEPLPQESLFDHLRHYRPTRNKAK
jgi:Capsular polysaccharide synthesis protein